MAGENKMQSGTGRMRGGRNVDKPETESITRCLLVRANEAAIVNHVSVGDVSNGCCRQAPHHHVLHVETADLQSWSNENTLSPVQF